MPYIKCIDEKEATGEVAEVYQDWLKANPHREQLPDILKCFSTNAKVLKGVMQLCYPLHFSDGSINRRQKEMIATYVSGLNQCPY